MEENPLSVDRLSQPLAFLYIEAVARCGSIRGAGDMLNVAAPAINRKIIQYEMSLGCAVFERLPRGVRLTAAGERLLTHIRRERSAFEKLRVEIDNLRGGKGGHVEIASVEVAPRLFLARDIAAFHKQFPKVTYDVKIHGSKKVFEAILHEEAVIGLGMNPPGNSNLVSLFSASYFIHAVVSKDHELTEKELLTLKECTGFQLGLFDNTFGTYPILGAALHELFLEAEAVAHSNSLTFLMDLAASSSLICFDIFPNLRTRRMGELVTIPIAPSEFPNIALHLVIRKNRGLEPAAAALSERIGKTIMRMAQP